MFDTLYNFIEEKLDLFNNQFNLIFRSLYDQGSYTNMGLMFIIIPIIGMALFYFLWRYPYAKRWHWVVYMLVLVIIAAGLTLNHIRLELASFIISTDVETADFANSLTLKYTFINAILTLLVAITISFVFRPFSKIQMHLPF